MLVLLFSLLLTFTAQPQCGIADSISYPVDTNQFRLGQNYGTASPRHQGRFHTGEDWFAGRGASLGQPVRAAARGRVTYSSPLAWGRDGGVIIIEHTFPDGSIFYTQYGHLTQGEDQTFAPRLSCVEKGDLLGYIGTARPAPHLHFEVRSNNPDIPGPGYTTEFPDELGWLRPAKLIANLQAQLSPAYEWHVTTRRSEQNPPPLVLNDQSLLALDGQRLIRVTPDGRVLWRNNLERTAVALSGYQANAYVVYDNGTFEQVDVTDGTLGELWRVPDFAPDGPPLADSLVYHTADDALVELTPNRREVLWRLDDVPDYAYGHVADDLIGLVIDEELWLIARDGTLINRSLVENGTALSTSPDGALIAYTLGGLWQISADGTWDEVLAGVPAGGETGAAVVLDDGRVYLLDGPSIYAYTAAGGLAWQALLPQTVTGRATITTYDGLLLITSSHGNLLAVREQGGICGFTRVYGHDRTPFWHDRGDDGLLRIMVGDELTGLSWQQLTAGC